MINVNDKFIHTEPEAGFGRALCGIYARQRRDCTCGGFSQTTKTSLERRHRSAAQRQQNEQTLAAPPPLWSRLLRGDEAAAALVEALQRGHTRRLHSAGSFAGFLSAATAATTPSTLGIIHCYPLLPQPSSWCCSLWPRGPRSSRTKTPVAVCEASVLPFLLRLVLEIDVRNGSRPEARNDQTLILPHSALSPAGEFPRPVSHVLSTEYWFSTITLQNSYNTTAT